MALRPGDDFDRDILDIIPERFDADADSREARAGHRLRTWVTVGLAVAAVGGIVAGGLHFMGGKKMGGAGIPVIKADERPLKVRPDDRGGMQVPNQDKLVYERMEQGAEGDKVERLLPPPETPKALPKASGPQIDLPSAKPAAAPEVIKPQQQQQMARQAPPPPPPAAEEPPPAKAAPPQPVAPAPVATPPAATSGGYQPVQARGSSTATALPPSPVVDRPVLPPNPAATVPPKPAPQPAPQVAAAPHPQVAAAPAPPVAVQPPPQPKPAAVVAAPKAPASGDYVIQLGALRAADLAEKEWSRIQKANHDLLGALKSDIVRVELEGKGTFWRLRAGPLSEQAARQLCTELSSRSQGCIVARK